MVVTEENLNKIINNIHKKHTKFYNEFKIIKKLLYIDEIDNLKKKNNDNNKIITILTILILSLIVILLFVIIAKK